MYEVLNSKEVRVDNFVGRHWYSGQNESSTTLLDDTEILIKIDDGSEWLVWARRGCSKRSQLLERKF